MFCAKRGNLMTRFFFFNTLGWGGGGGNCFKILGLSAYLSSGVCILLNLTLNECKQTMVLTVKQ